MNKFQPLHFPDINAFLEYLPSDELEIVLALRGLIFEALPHCTEKLAYNVPYYYLNSRAVFLWPGAIPWGGLREPGVQLGFCKGSLLPSKDLLDHGTRKQVFSLHFPTLPSIDPSLIRHLLQEAQQIDTQEASSKKSKRP